MFEHTQPHHDHTIIAHYAVNNNMHQEVYIGLTWSEVSAKLALIIDIVDPGGIDVMVVSAELIDFENNHPHYKDGDGDLI